MDGMVASRTYQFLIKKVHAKLRRKKRNIFDDSKANTPLLITCKVTIAGSSDCARRSTPTTLLAASRFEMTLNAHLNSSLSGAAGIRE